MAMQLDQIGIFPLLALSLERSPYLERAIAHLEQQGYQCTIQTVTYQLQRGGNEVLVIRKPL